jgi:hypothetical protein
VGLRKGRRARTYTLDAFGVRVALDIADPELEAAVIDVLPGAWRQPGRVDDASGRFGLTRSERGGYRITSDSLRGSEHATLEVALGMLETYVDLAIAINALDWIFVHAGAVSWDGKALLVPGESFSGKTTLVAAMVEAGATYYSDEFAVLDRAGRVHAYPRRLSLRTSDGQPGAHVHARQLGGMEAHQSAEVGVVVFTEYRPGAAWRPKPMPPAQAVVQLLPSTLASRERPVDSVQMLARAVSGARVVEGERGEAGPTAAALMQMLKA